MIGGSMASPISGGFVTVASVGILSTFYATLSKVHHLVQTLEFESAMANPSIPRRLFKQSGIALKVLSAPLFAWSYLKIADYITKTGILKFLTPPGKEVLKAVTFKAHKIPKGELGRDIIRLTTWLGAPVAIGITAYKFLEEERNPLLEPIFWSDSLQTYLGLTIYGNALAAADSFMGIVQMIATMQVSLFLTDRFFQNSMSLYNGHTPDARYTSFSAHYSITISPFIMQPIDAVANHGIRNLFKAGDKVPVLFWANMVATSLWEYVAWGYPMTNAANSALVDYVINKDLGFWESIGRLKFSDFHIQTKQEFKKPENPFNLRDFNKDGILSFDKDEFESIQYLMKYYGNASAYSSGD